MKKTDLGTLRGKLGFMKRHLKTQTDFDRFVAAVLSQVEKRAPFEMKGWKDKIAREEKNKKKIQAVARALKKLSPEEQALLSRDDNYDPHVPFCCFKGKQYGVVPLLLKQCEGALSELEYDAATPDRLFFQSLGTTYTGFTGKQVAYNRTGVFIHLCTEAYLATGLYDSEKGDGYDLVRDRVRKHVCIFFNPTLSGDQSGRKYFPKRCRNSGKK